jgi:hypothetical protein
MGQQARQELLPFQSRGEHGQPVSCSGREGTHVVEQDQACQGLVNGKDDTKFITKCHTEVIHGIAQGIGEVVKEVFHVHILQCFKLRFEFGMVVVPGCKRLTVDEGHD